MRDKREGSSSRPERSGERRDFSSDRRNSSDSERKPYRSSEGDSGSGQKGYFARKRDEGDSRFSRGDSPRGERSSYSSGGGYQGRSDSERKPYASRDDNRTPRTDDSRKNSPYSSGGREERRPYASRDDNRSSRSGDSERKPYSSSSGGYQGRSDRDDSRKSSFGGREERKPYASRDDNRSPRSGDSERKPYSSSSGGYQGRSDRDDSRKSSFGGREERKPYASRDDNRSSRSGDSERKSYSSAGGGYQGRSDRDDSRKSSFGGREERKPYSRDAGYQRDENRKTSFGGREERKTYSRDDSDRSSFSDRPSRTKKESFETSYEEKNAAKMIDRNSVEDDTRNTYIYGRHPVIEALKGETAINKVWIGEGTRDTDQIVQYIKDKDIPYKIVSKMKLSYMVGEDTNHQGVVAEIAAREYTDLHDLVELAKQKQVFYIILDKLEDPHNLGAVIRTADAVGADAVIISKHRAVGLTGIVTKASAGAIDRMKVCRVSNLNQAMDELKKANVWIVGVDMEGKEVYSSANLKGSIALAMGGEGEGLTKLVKENCDFIVKIPMHSQSNSLNVSVATAVVAYEIFKQRDYKTIDAVQTQSQAQTDVSSVESPVAPQVDVEVESPVAAPDLLVADVITPAGNIDVDI